MRPDEAVALESRMIPDAQDFGASLNGGIINFDGAVRASSWQAKHVQATRPST